MALPFPSHDAGARPKPPKAPPLVRGPWQVAPSGPPSAPAGDSAAPGSSPGGSGNSNPWYNQLESMYRAQGASEAAGMRDSIRQMLIGFGLVPTGFQDKFGALDDTTRALIAKNTDTGISTMARLNEQKGMGIKDLVNRLQARGLRRSGARGYGLRKNQLAYDRTFADSLSQMMSQIGGMYSGYANNEYGRQAALMQAAMQYFTGVGQSAPSGGDSWSNSYTPTGLTQANDWSGNPGRSDYGRTPSWAQQIDLMTQGSF